MFDLSQKQSVRLDSGDTWFSNSYGPQMISQDSC